MPLYLESKDGSWALTDGQVSVGRSSDCTIQIKDPRISRKHAVFTISDRMVTVEDCGSSNGVLLNGERIHEVSVVMPDDAVVVGPCLFRLRHMEKPTPATEPSSKSKNQSIDLIPSTDSSNHKGVRTSELFGPPPGTIFPQSDSKAKQNSASNVALTQRKTAGDSRHVDRNIQAVVAGEESQPIGPKLSSDDVLMPSENVRTLSDDALQRKDAANAKKKNVSSELVISSEAAIAAAGGRRAPWKQRCIAGILDGGITLFIVAVIVFACLLIGFLLAQGQAAESDTQLAPWHFRMNEIFSAQGLSRSLEQVFFWRTDKTAAFAIFFGAATCACLAVVLVPLFTLVIPTMLTGAPRWHQHFGLEIIDLRTRSYPGAIKVSLRYLLAIVLLPLTIITMAIGVTGLHDRLTGCRLAFRG
jgi:hypothetical protein